MITRCSSPNNNDMASWYFKFSFPILKNKILLYDIFFSNKNSLDSFDPDTGTLSFGDTLQISFKDTLSNINSHNIFSFKDISIEKKIFSELKIKNIPVITCSLSLSNLTIPSVQLPISLPIILQDSITIPGIDYVVFDESSDSILLTIENNSDSLYLRNIVLTIVSNGIQAVAIDTISQLLPNSNVALHSSIADVKIGNNIYITLNAEIENESVINSNSAIIIKIDINEQQIREALLDDYFVDYSFEFNYDLQFTKDNFKIAYLDLSEMNLPLEIINGTCWDFSVSYTIGNIFEIPYCKNNNIESCEDLLLQNIDSTSFLGNDFLSLIIEGVPDPHIYKTQQFIIGMKNARFLPEWDSHLLANYIPVKIKGTINKNNKKVYVDKNSFACLEIKSPQINFVELHGFYLSDHKFVNQPEYFSSPLSGISNISKSIRNKLKLVNNDLLLDIEFPFTDNTSLTKINYEIVLFQPDTYEQISDTLTFGMDSISQGSHFNYTFKVNKLINSFPDSLCYILSYTFPANSDLVFCKDVFNNGPNYSSIDIHSIIKTDLNLKLIWEILDTVQINLEDMFIPLSFDKGIIPFVQDKKLSLHYSLTNQTNVIGYIFGLGTTKNYHHELYELSPEDISPQILSTGKAEHFIPVYGVPGFILPQRDDSVTDSIIYNDITMNDIINSDSLLVRWSLFLLPSKAGAFTDTDYIYLDGQLSLEGIQSLETLIED